MLLGTKDWLCEKLIAGYNEENRSGKGRTEIGRIVKCNEMRAWIKAWQQKWKKNTTDLIGISEIQSSSGL